MMLLNLYFLFPKAILYEYKRELYGLNSCLILTWTGLYSKIDGREGDTMIGLRSNATFSWDLKCFTLKELKTATGNLVPDSQGWIDDAALAPGKAGYGFTVAVKKINEGSRQEHGVWLVSVIRKLSSKLEN